MPDALRSCAAVTAHHAAHHLPTLNIVMGSVFLGLAALAIIGLLIMLWQDAHYG